MGLGVEELHVTQDRSLVLLGVVAVELLDDVLVGVHETGCLEALVVVVRVGEERPTPESVDDVLLVKFLLSHD